MPVPTKPVKKPPAVTGKPEWPAFTEKFGSLVRRAGVSTIPRVLLTGLGELKLKPTEALVLIELIMCWGKSGPHPFPKRANLMKWIGCDKRTLDRAIAKLVEHGFIQKGKHKIRGRTVSNEYDLSGLVEKLRPLGRKAVNEKKEKEAKRAGKI